MSTDKQHYTGIGARDVPGEVASIIVKIAAHMARQGYVLRSGGAEGSSTEFEKGCDGEGGEKFIYLPWRGFNGNNSPHYSIPERAFDIAKSFEPAWNSFSQSAKSLKARYALTILGHDLKKPSACVICYTQGGKHERRHRTGPQDSAEVQCPHFRHRPPRAVDCRDKRKALGILERCSPCLEGLEL